MKQLMSWKLLVATAACVLVISKLSEAAPLAWSDLSQQQTNAPSARALATCAFDNSTQSIWMYGGVLGATNEFTDELWKLDVQTLAWVKVSPTGSIPARRFSLVSGFEEANQKFCIAGGEGDKKEIYDDAWCYSPSGNSWTMVAGTEKGKKRPGKRYGHAGGMIGPELFVWGGFDTKIRLNDLWGVNVNGNEGWKMEKTPMRAATARCIVGTTVFRDQNADKIAVVGGCGNLGYGPCPHHETLVISKNGKTELAESCAGTSTYASLASAKDGAIHFGGKGIGDGSTVYDLSKPGGKGKWKWQARSINGVVPEHRRDNCFVQVSSDRWITFSGGSKNDLWELKGNPAESKLGKCKKNGINLRAVHGGLMCAGWAFLLPLGEIAARYFKNAGDPSSVPRLWFKIHRGIQSLGLLLTIAGTIVIFYVVDSESTHFSVGQRGHPYIGIITMVLGVLQPVNAALRPHPPAPGEKKSTKRLAFEIVHKFGGRLALLMGAINCILGLLLFGLLSNAAYACFLTLLVWLCILALVHIVLEVRLRVSNKASKPKPIEMQGAGPEQSEKAAA